MKDATVGDGKRTAVRRVGSRFWNQSGPALMQKDGTEGMAKTTQVETAEKQEEAWTLAGGCFLLDADRKQNCP